MATHNRVSCNLKNDNIDFHTADLILDTSENVLNIRIEAFKSSLNDEIIKEGNPSKYGQLNWFSIDYPKLEINSKTNSCLFDINSLGFSIRVQMLTGEHKSKFLELLKKKYGIEVNSRQILNLVPSKLECKAEFFSDEDEELHLITGKVNNFQEFPLRVEFKAPKKQQSVIGYNQRRLYDKFIKNETNILNLQFNCELNANMNETKQNYLIKESFISIYDLFGDIDEVYVTRNQIQKLIPHIYIDLNIQEEFLFYRNTI